MHRQFLVLSFGVGAMLLAAQHAFAQTSRYCADRPIVVERLANIYGETRQSIGLGANNTVVEMFASTQSGTWTLTVTVTSGLTCIVAAGDAFERLTDAPVVDGEDT